MGRGPTFAAWVLAAAGVLLASHVDAAPRGRARSTAQPAKKKTRPARPAAGRPSKPSTAAPARPRRAATSGTAAASSAPAASSTPQPSTPPAPSGPPTPWSDGRIYTTTFPEDSLATRGTPASTTTSAPSASAATTASATATSSPLGGSPHEGPESSPSLNGAERDQAIEPRSVPRRRVTIGLNPLPLIAGRYGVNVELVPFRHHALVASAWLQTFTPTMLRVLMPNDVDVRNGAGSLLGGELGYRLYTGTDGAHGLFAGVSGVAMPIAYPRVSSDLKTEVLSFHAYGGAFDIGAQAITSSGFTIGGGLGVMYLAYTPPASVQPPPGVSVPSVPEPHVLPRLLLSAGWSF